MTTLQRTVGRAWDLAPRYGVGVLQQSPGQRHTRPRARDPRLGRANRDHAECARAVALDGCDVIVLGCAGMADLAVDISARIGVPVVDGVVAATTMVQSPVGMGLATSRRGEFARPIPKDVGGLLAGFALGEPAVSGPQVPVGLAAPPLAAPMVGAPGRILPGAAGNRCGRLQVSARRGTRHDRQVIAGPGYAHRRRLIGREGRCRSE